MPVEQEKVPSESGKILFDPKPPTPEQLAARKKFVESRALKAFFPIQIIDSENGLSQAAELLKDGNSIILVVSPHPGTGEIPRAELAILLNEYIREQIQLIPMAIHMSQKRIEGKVIHLFADKLGIHTRDLITDRTRERYPNTWTIDEQTEYFNTYMMDLIKVLNLGSFDLVFDQGDRGLDLKTKPRRGIMKMIFAIAKKFDRENKTHVLNKIYILPAYLFNPSVRPNDQLHELDLFINQKLFIGQPISLIKAHEESEKLELAESTEKADKLDTFIHQLIIDIRDRHLPELESKKIDRVLYQINKVIFSFAQKLMPSKP